MYCKVVTDVLVTMPDGEVKKAYGAEAVAVLSLARPADSVRNADSYRWFAIAAYLDAYDWSRTVGGTFYSSSAIVARSRNASKAATSGRATAGWEALQMDAGRRGAESDLKRTTFFWRRFFS